MLSAVHHILNTVSEWQGAGQLPINFCLQESKPLSGWMFVVYQGVFYSYTMLFYGTGEYWSVW